MVQGRESARDASIFEATMVDDWRPRSPRLGSLLAALAAENPSKCIKIALEIIEVSPRFSKVGRGDCKWTEDVGRTIGSVALCLGTAERAKQGGEPYAPNWGVQIPALGDEESEDFFDDILGEFRGPVAISSKQIAGASDWREWRGFEELAKMALAGEAVADNAERCALWAASWTLEGKRRPWMPSELLSGMEQAEQAMRVIIEREILSATAPAILQRPAAAKRI